MANANSDGSPRFVSFALAGLLLVCVTMSAMVIAGSETIADGIAMVAVTVITGLLYGLLAIRADERAQREWEERSRD